jgi:hypothetical protein
MDFEEVISCLQDREKCAEFVARLKTAGANSNPVFNVEDAMVELKMNRTPRGIDEKTTLQHTFRFTEVDECFQSFRLVCKSWQNAVETSRWDKHLPLSIFHELCQNERHGRFPPFFGKYLKCFKNYLIYFDQEILTHWNSIAKLLLENMKSLQKIAIYGTKFPPQFTIFLFKILQNSKNTLKVLNYSEAQEILPFPNISLPNLEKYVIRPKADLNIDSFAYFMESFIKNMCPSLKEFLVIRISKAPEMLDYLVKHFPNHFVCAPQISVLEHIPLKISHLNIQNLAQYRYVSNIEYLSLDTNLHNPNSFSWNDYQDITTFFPNLKGIVLYDNGYYLNPNMSIQPISSHLKNIWNQRLQYFTSKNIQVLSGSEFKKIESEAEKSACTRYIFLFENF